MTDQHNREPDDLLLDAVELEQESTPALQLPTDVTREQVADVLQPHETAMDSQLASDPAFENLVMFRKVENIRKPENLGEYSRFRYAVCSYETERAEFGSNSIREAITFAEEKYGRSHYLHCLIVKVPKQVQKVS